MQRYKIWLATGAVLGCLAVILGAFGAHRLESALASHDHADLAKKLANWETAARYNMYHALALLAVGILAARRCGWSVHLAGSAMTLGTLLFSGCLYAYVLGGPKWLVWVVPFGGLLLIVGWICLAIAAAVHTEADDQCRRVV